MSLLFDATKKHEAGELRQAAGLYEAFLRENVGHAEALNLYGLCMHGLGEFKQADTLFTNAISCKPTKPELYQNRGTTRMQMQKSADALFDFETTLKFMPENIDCLLFAGSTCIKLHKFDRAVKFFQEAVSLNPKHDGASAGLAYSLSARGLQKIKNKKFADAILDLTNAQSYCQDSWEIAYNLGNAYLKSFDYQMAQNEYEKAKKLNSENIDLFCNLAVSHERQGNFSDAMESYDQALNLVPNHQATLYNKSLLLLKLGHYSEGTRLYENRWDTPEFAKIKRNFEAPLWLGEKKLDGKTILCHAEQGLGDTIQFLWFCLLFDTSETKVLIQCDSGLVEIAKSMNINAEFFSFEDALPEFDVHCPLMSLPFAFRYDPNRLPQRAKYMSACHQKRVEWNTYLGSRNKPRIGLVLEGKESHIHNHLRSVFADDFINILPKNVDYFLLQKKLSPRTKMLVNSRSDVRDLSSELLDFADTAAVCVNMDLIITVDTAVAHLSGALGCPTTLLLHYQSDWRWGLETKNSHWYSNMSLIRLKRNGEWPDTYAEISATIESIV